MGSAITEQLDAILRGPDGSFNPEVKVVLSKLAAEVKHRFEKGTPASYEFLVATVRSISKIRGGMHAEVRLASLFDCSAFFLANQFHIDALHSADLLVALAKQARQQQWLRKGFMLKGLANGHLGDCGESVKDFAVALSLTEGAPADHKAATLVNLGATLNYAGLYREAIPCFHRAIALANNHPELPSHEANALCNLAQSYLSLEEFELGLAAITDCLAKSEEPTQAFDAFNRTVRESTYVQIALEVGRLSAAREHAKYCYHYAQQSGVKKALFLAGIAQGLCEVHGGNTARGLSAMERAIRTSCDEGSAEYIAALSALVRSYDHAMLPEKALAVMSSLLNAIRIRRTKSIGAFATAGTLVASNDDLRPLRTREATLRARVAEMELISSRLELLERFAVTADLREEATGEHGYRVGRLAFHLAKEIGWQKDVLTNLEMAAKLHDIGKVSLPDRLLLSTRELQVAERHFISTHTTIGAELLGKSNIPQLRMAEEIARYHHEWWNGEGYPSKLKGKRIPIHARIVALADVFDALIHGRPFSPAWPIDKALEEIRGRRGTQFDPELTDLFLDLIDRLRKEHQDLDEYLGRAGKASPFLQARNRIRELLADERKHEKMATVEGNQTRH